MQCHVDGALRPWATCGELALRRIDIDLSKLLVLRGSRMFWRIENFLPVEKFFFTGQEFFGRSRMFFVEII